MSIEKLVRGAMAAALGIFVCLSMTIHWAPAVAAPQQPPPFANAVEQRAEMISELKSIHTELKRLNDVLRSGQLTVVVAESPTAKGPRGSAQ